MKKSKRAQVPEAVLLLVALAICGYSLWAVYAFERQTASQISIPEKLMDLYSNQDKFEIYAKEAGKLSIDEAFSNVVKEKYDCTILSAENEQIPIWDGCISKDKTEIAFLKNADESFKKRLLPYAYRHKLSIENKNFRFEFDEINANVSEENYNASYSYRTIFFAENPIKEDFGSIYSRLISKKAGCLKEKEKNPSVDLGSCISNMQSDEWNAECMTSGLYLICALKTKANYFHSNSFKPVEMGFALRI